MTFQQLLSQPRLGGRGPGLAAGEAAAGVGGATAEGGVEGVVGVLEEGGDKGEDSHLDFLRLVDDSGQRADGLTLDLLDHAHDYHGNEAGLELGL